MIFSNELIKWSATITIITIVILVVSFQPESVQAQDDSYSLRVQKVTNMEGLVAFWDFVKREDKSSNRFIAHVPKGERYTYALDAGNYVREYWGRGEKASYDDFPLMNRGPFGQAIRIVDEEDPYFRPLLYVPRSRLHNTPLDIKGKGKSLTVVVWAIRESGNHALAGIWHEGTDLREQSTVDIKKVVRGQRQYGLFAGLDVEGSACGHISENGASSFMNRYALNKAHSEDRAPMIPADTSDHVLDQSWHTFAMTFDHTQNEVTAWLDGVAGDRWFENPQDHPLYSSIAEAWLQGYLNDITGIQSGEDSTFPSDQYFKPPEETALSVTLVEETAQQRTEIREYEYTRVKVTIQKGSDGEDRIISRKLVAVRINPWWFPHGIYAPQELENGGPFTIGRTIHSARLVGFTGWIGGVAVFDRALRKEELILLSTFGKTVIPKP
jgi:hypothetical protein